MVKEMNPLLFFVTMIVRVKYAIIMGKGEEKKNCWNPEKGGKPIWDV